MKRNTRIGNLIMAGAVIASMMLTISYSPKIEPREGDNIQRQSYTPTVEKPSQNATSLEIELVSDIITGEEELDKDLITSQEISEVRIPNAAAPYRYKLTDAERAAVEKMVASEGGYCPYEFQALVAECILNGCEAEDLRPLELFERGDFWLTHDVVPTNDTKQAVSDVFDLGVMPTDEPIRYYYNPTYCSSPAHETFCYVLTNCGCRFFKDWE